MNTLIFHRDRVGELQISCDTVTLPQSIEDSLARIEAVRFAFRGLDYAPQNEFPLEKWQKMPFFFEWMPIDIFLEISSYHTFRLPFEVKINGQPTNLSINHTQKGQRLSGKISLGNAVGFSEIKIVDARGDEVFALFMEVFPQKLDYKEDFHEMIGDISDIVYNLAFDYLKKSYAFVRPRYSENVSLNEWLAILNQLFEFLEKSIDHILRKPSSKVIQENRIKPVEKIRRFHPHSYKWMVQNRKYLKREDRKGVQLQNNLFVTHLPDAQKHLSHDTYANRFVKWAIGQIISQIQELSLQIRQQARAQKRISEELDVLSNYKMRLQQRLKNAVLAEVKDLKNERWQSNVLSMSPVYRDFYHRFLLLRRGLYLHDSDIFRLDYKDIATLYEYWCFLTLIKSLTKIAGFDVENQDIVSIEHHKLRLRLKKGNASEIHLKSRMGDEVKIYYNKALSSDTFTQIPDNLLEFYKAGYQQPFRLLLDAKYRFDKGSKAYPRSKIQHGPPLDAISQLHRYRDAILFSEKNISTTKVTAERAMGGVILFPFPAEERTFMNHPFYQSIQSSNIGALPLLPGKKSRNTLFESYIEEIFEASPEALYEQQLEYNKSEYHSLLSKLEEKVWVVKMEGRDRQKQLDLIFNRGIYVQPYSVSQSFEIQQGEGLLIYDDELKLIYAYGKVDSFTFQVKDELMKLGIEVDLEQQKHIVFQLKDTTPFVLSMAQNEALTHTNQYALSQALASEDATLLWLKHYEEVKAWKELERIGQNISFEVIKNPQDVVPHLAFTFMYKRKKLICYLIENNTWCFYKEKNREIVVLEKRENMKKMLDANFQKLTS